ncbi:hypothetical protein BpHYR1_025098 [Brachionus plicatilis]|uniref:Uncharacterized protein n=1 Tax=Brachionus plicatilis TaxID=10195 RepID=A0A3M7RGL9_BRAPC|nr:hypothetical protein BpHYR1_025098 [Brachionus plicatilis]
MSSESNAVPVSDYASSSEEENLPETTQKNKKIRGKDMVVNNIFIVQMIEKIVKLKFIYFTMIRMMKLNYGKMEHIYTWKQKK